MRNFSFLLKRQWIESKRTFWIANLVFMGSLILLYIFNIINSMNARLGDTFDARNFAGFSELSFRVPVLIMTAVVYLAFLSNQHFSVFSRPQRAVSEIMMPVSVLARTVCAFILSTLVLLITCIFISLLVDVLSMQLLRNIYAEEVQQTRDQVLSMPSYAGFQYVYQTLTPRLSGILILGGLGICSAFTLGSVYFSKLSFLKTGAYLLLLFMGGGLLVAAIKNMFWSDYVRLSGREGMDFMQNNLNGIILLTILLVWVAIFYRLKEKEV